MTKFESANLEDAFKQAASHYRCSITELEYTVVQNPSSGFLGFFKKSAIIVAACRKKEQVEAPKESVQEEQQAQQKPVEEQKEEVKESITLEDTQALQEQKVLNDMILPVSFVSDQGEEYEEELSAQEYRHRHTQEIEKNYFQDEFVSDYSLDEVVVKVKEEINHLFKLACFEIDAIDVKAYDESTLLVEITGEDSALLIGKEGYRYKALSYMIFNWINSKYQLQLRLEIAEFLKNQEESVSRYLIGVCETIEREGRAQTKILDGVLVQIALKQLRETYPDKYVAIRSTREGLKFIIINDYNGY
jgi:spoIIIJ-associated protein